jgi:hypothetical protein
MIRRIGYVEQINWDENTCKVRIPNLDGMAKDEYSSEYLRMLLPNRPEVEDLQDSDIPYHRQGKNVNRDPIDAAKTLRCKLWVVLRGHRKLFE